ncbi:MAG: hypothetical protein KDJ77_08785, partial [Rhodobiaceae bacterium]|nr:hypothetical protein [Rhodobiaceae bacterium]
MLNVALGLGLLLIGVYLFVRKNPLTGRLAIIGSRGVGVVFLALGLFMLGSTSFVFVDANSVGHLKRIYGFTDLPEGHIVALDGQKGPQAQILGPGFHVIPLVRVLYDFEQYPVVTVPNGYYGQITALDGAAMPEGMFIAPAIPDDQVADMLKAETFLTQSGFRGPQETVLKPGSYRLNRYLFDIAVTEDTTATIIPAGHVGVVKSNVQQPGANCVEQEVRADALAGALSVPLVPTGCVGIWRDPLFPGAYYLNRNAYEVSLVDTR